MTAVCPPGLTRLYRTSRVIPFIGAGISAAVEWTDVAGDTHRGPSWSELVDEAARQLGFSEPSLARARGTDLQILEYYWARNSTFADLTAWLTSLRPPDEALRDSVIHRALADLDKCDLFYTTNFDNYLERAFDLHNRVYRRVAIEAHLAELGGEQRCDIVKFHGDLSYPEEMVLSESHYEQRLKLRKPMDYRLRSDALARALLFLGYSFRDWNVAYLFRLVSEEFGVSLPESSDGRRGYIVVADPSDFEIRLFRARNIEVIPIGSEHREADIAQLLEEMRG